MLWVCAQLLIVIGAPTRTIERPFAPLSAEPASHPDSSPAAVPALRFARVSCWPLSGIVRNQSPGCIPLASHQTDERSGCSRWLRNSVARRLSRARLPGGVPGPRRDAWIPGGFGVTVFFFLSGYLITTLLRLEAERSGRINFKLFYLRRVLRILPPFYLVLATALRSPWCTRFQVHCSCSPCCRRRSTTRTIGQPSAVSTAPHPARPCIGRSRSRSISTRYFRRCSHLLVGLRTSGKSQRSILLSLCALALVWRCVLVFHFHVPDSANLSDDGHALRFAVIRLRDGRRRKPGVGR